MLVIAEYVHKEDVYKKVKELNIDRSQGFYLAEPQEKAFVFLTLSCNSYIFSSSCRCISGICIIDCSSDGSYIARL